MDPYYWTNTVWTIIIGQTQLGLLLLDGHCMDHWTDRIKVNKDTNKDMDTNNDMDKDTNKDMNKDTNKDMNKDTVADANALCQKIFQGYIERGYWLRCFTYAVNGKMKIVIEIPEKHFSRVKTEIEQQYRDHDHDFIFNKKIYY